MPFVIEFDIILLDSISSSILQNLRTDMFRPCIMPVDANPILGQAAEKVYISKYVLARDA